MSGRSGNPARTGWDPITLGRASSATAEAFPAYLYRHDQDPVALLAFDNRLYNGLAARFPDGSMHLSFKRRDRAAVRDWRHFQAIKNEVAGPDREAVEIFPPENQLLDGSNQYHLWVLPPGQHCPWGLELTGPAVLDADDTHDHAAYRQGGPSGARQRAWEPGIPTGLGLGQDGRKESP